MHQNQRPPRGILGRVVLRDLACLGSAHLAPASTLAPRARPRATGVGGWGHRARGRGPPGDVRSTRHFSALRGRSVREYAIILVRATTTDRAQTTPDTDHGTPTQVGVHANTQHRNRQQQVSNHGRVRSRFRVFRPHCEAALTSIVPLQTSTGCHLQFLIGLREMTQTVHGTCATWVCGASSEIPRSKVRVYHDHVWRVQSYEGANVKALATPPPSPRPAPRARGACTERALRLAVGAGEVPRRERGRTMFKHTGSNLSCKGGRAWTLCARRAGQPTGPVVMAYFFGPRLMIICSKDGSLSGPAYIADFIADELFTPV